MTSQLKKCERERQLEKIRGKKRRRSQGSKRLGLHPLGPGAPGPSPPVVRTREFEDSPSAHKYARHFGGTVEAVTPPGYPVYYVVTVPVPGRRP